MPLILIPSFYVFLKDKIKHLLSFRININSNTHMSLTFGLILAQVQVRLALHILYTNNSTLFKFEYSFTL